MKSMTNLYCNNCQQNVGAQPALGLLQYAITMILLICGFVPGVIYFIYAYNAKKFKTCPKCLGRNFDAFKTKIDE